MRNLILTTAAVAAAIGLAGCSKKPVLESVSETPNTLTDSRDGQTYRTVKIGGMTWMAQNLNYRSDRYWSYGYEDSNKSWCYDDKDFNCDEYGKLYDRETAMTACPAGWHLPSRWELDSLGQMLGDDGQPSSYGKGSIVWRGAGKKLKAKHSWNWDDYNNISGNGTDDYGFSALSGGYRDTNGDYHFAGIYGVWWTTTEPYYWGMINYKDDLAMDSRSKGAYSVRCVQDAAGWFLRRDTPNADSAIIDEVTASIDSILNSIKNMKTGGCCGDSDGSLKLKKKKNNINRSGVDDLLDELARETYKLTGEDIRFKSRDKYSNCLLTCFECRGSQVTRVAKGTRNIRSITLMVMKNKAALCYAYSKRLREKPGLTGAVYVNFTIDEFGNVTSAQLVESTVSDPELENTVVSRVKSWKFEKIDQSGDVTDITYRFVFSQ